MIYKIMRRRGQSYNGSKIEKAIDSITDDDFNFKGDYELILEIKKLSSVRFA